MANETIGQYTLRAENVEKVVKGLALRKYVFKQICTVESSSSWLESYYQESSTTLTAGATASVKGVPRLAQFPYAGPNWTKKTSYLLKHGCEGIVSWEDSLTDNIPVIKRTYERIAQAVTKSVDAEIYTAITGDASVNTLPLTIGYEWNATVAGNRDPIGDVLNAKRLIEEDDVDTSDAYLLVSPQGYKDIISNSKVCQNPTYKAADIITNGNMGKLLGAQILVSNNVAADYAAVVVKGCAVWKEAVPLTVHTIVNEGISYTIRAVELGVTQLLLPTGVCYISNTAV